MNDTRSFLHGVLPRGGLFVTCYAMSIMINATFDVTLEGPMQGIWFWCLFGFGIGSVMIYRAQGATETTGSISGSIGG